jgi:dienelactone hydrolase
MKKTLALILVLLWAASAQAGLKTQEMDYTDGETTLKGYLAYDDTATGERPGILVVHEWWGLNDFVKERAEKLAQAGYVAFAVDMYGQGEVTTDPKEAARMAGHLRGKPLLRRRAKAGLEVLLARKGVDPAKVAAIGFCFGGTTVLELAFSGVDLAGVVSFHGGLVAPKPEDMDRIKAKILVLHGAEDGFVKPEAISAFQEAMIKAQVDWQMVFYGGAVHSFTNPGAGDDKTKGLAFNPSAAERSWEHMKLFFAEILGP